MSLLTNFQSVQSKVDDANWWANRILQHKPIYTELEYIQSTGNQFIDTGYIPRATYTKYELGFMRTGISTSWSPIINSEEDVRFGIVCRKNTDSNYGSCWAGSSSSYRDRDFPISSNVKYNIVFDKTGIELNGTKYSFSGTVTSATGSWSTMINHRHKSASGYSDEYSLGRWYYLRIYDNGTLKRDFVPCKDKSGVVCMYDKVDKKYYYNIGSGSFTAGPEVN